MNIFEIFCDGNGRIGETNMSSILNFLLDPVRAHGFGHASIARFLMPIRDKLNHLNGPNDRMSLSKTSELEFDRWVKRFSRIELTLEEDVYEPEEENKAPRKRVLDSVIRFSYGQDLCWVLAIENKTSMASASEIEQLSEEYDFLRAITNKNVPIVFIFLTPTPVHNKSEIMFNNLTMKDGDIKFNYVWKDTANTPCSITKIVKKLLEDERSGIINPASSHADLFLRSMIKFIANDFRLETPLEDSIAGDTSMRLISADEFWEMWKDNKNESYLFAKEISELVKTSLENYCKDSEFSQIYKLEIRSVSTRLAYFYRRLDQEVDLQQKRLPNRPVAIFYGGLTSKKRVQLQFERREGVSLENFRRSLSDQVREIFDKFLPDESSLNHSTLLLQTTTDLNALQPLLDALVKEAAQAAIG